MTELTGGVNKPGISTFSMTENKGGVIQEKYLKLLRPKKGKASITAD